MSKTRKTFAIILGILTVCTLAFIWGNSILSIGSSAERSGNLYEKLKGVLDFLFGEGIITHDVFRKMAHGGEFFIFGLELNFLFLSLNKYQVKTVIYILLCGFFVAVIDETLQIFSNRGSSLTDVWIDFGGIFTACLIIGATYYLGYKISKLKQNKDIKSEKAE